ncbi:MAG: DUF3300 domain-containing protein [Terracidiphilus sp.]
MNPRTILRVSSLERLAHQINQTPRQSLSCEFSAQQRPGTTRWIFGAALTVLALAFAADMNAQQPYPGAPYDNSGAPYPGGQYARPRPPQDQQPQYAPQYAPQQQPDADQQPYSAPAPQYAQPDQSQQPPPAQALSAEDLEQLLAPIALYPDSLLAQVLAASTYPAQVAVADQWLQQMRAQGYSSPDQIAAGANAQSSWDPSIKALTAFPDVLDMMNHDLEWTANLGNAYYNQPQDVMQTVQVLRDRAEQAGNLQTTPQEEVNNDQGYVELEPTNPEVVYVPTYNPWDVYGAPIAPYPGFSLFGALGNFFGDVPIQYGLSFALGAFDRMPFGWLAWGCDWLGHALLFDHSGYYTRSNQVADWGLPRGGPRAFYGHGGNGGMRDGANQGYGERQGYNQGGGQRGGWQNDRGGSGDHYGNGGAQSYVRPAQGFPEPGRLDYSNRGYSNRGSQQPSYGYTRPAMPGQQMNNRSGQQPYERVAPQQNYGYRPQTYPNRAPAYTNPGYSSRPQTYSNPGYRYGYTGQTTSSYPGSGYSRNSYSAPQSYATRPGFTYSNPSSSYRAAPQPDNSHGFSSRGYSNRSYENYGNTITRNQHSGGFHLFGGGQPKSFGGQRAPSYSYKAPKSFGGGHQSFGGGHMSAPKMSHSSGGGGGGNHRR